MKSVPTVNSVPKNIHTATSAFFSRQDPSMVEWFVKMVEERKSQHDSSKEKKNW